MPWALFSLTFVEFGVVSGAEPDDGGRVYRPGCGCSYSNAHTTSIRTLRSSFPARIGTARSAVFAAR